MNDLRKDWDAVQLNRQNSKTPDEVARSLGVDGGLSQTPRQ